MSNRKILGWIVTVHFDDGAQLYAVREEIAFRAEDYVREKLKLPSSVDISAFKPIDKTIFESFKMALTKMRGPF